MSSSDMSLSTASPIKEDSLFKVSPIKEDFLSTLSPIQEDLIFTLYPSQEDLILTIPPYEADPFLVDDLILLETLHTVSKTTVPFTGNYCIQMRERFSEALHYYKEYLSECVTEKDRLSVITEFVDEALLDLDDEYDFESDFDYHEYEMYKIRDAENAEYEKRRRLKTSIGNNPDYSDDDTFDTDRLEGNSIFNFSLCM